MINLKMTSTFLRISRILLVVFVAILILVIPQLNFPEYVLPTITSKMIYFLYGIIILCVISTFIIVFSKELTFSVSKVDIAFFLLLLYISFNRYLIQSQHGLSIRYIELLALSMFYVVLRTIDIKNYSLLLLSIVFSGSIQAIYGNLQLLGYYASNHSGFKMTGSFFNPGPYAGFLGCVWIVALGMYLFKDEIINSIKSQTKSNIIFFNKFFKSLFEYIPLLGLISIAMILPALQSRASWIATIVGSSVLIELKFRLFSRLLKKVTGRIRDFFLILLTICVLIVGLFSLYHYKKASSDGRAFIWKVTIEMITDAPIFGVGFDLFKANYMDYQGQYFNENVETSEELVADDTYYAFNEWLQFIAENGFLGFLFLTIVILILFQTKVDNKCKIEFYIAKTALLTIGFFSFFSYPMQILPIKIILVFSLAILSSVNVDRLKIRKYMIKQKVYQITIISLCGFFTYKTIHYTKSLSRGFVAWNTAIIYHQSGDYNRAIFEYEAIYSIFYDEGEFLINYGKTLAMAGEFVGAIEILERAQLYQKNTIILTSLGDSYKGKGQYNKAETYYQQAINMIPSRFYPMYLLAKLYDISGQEDKAVLMAKKLIKKDVKISSTAINEIKEEMRNILNKDLKNRKF